MCALRSNAHTFSRFSHSSIITISLDTCFFSAVALLFDLPSRKVPSAQLITAASRHFEFSVVFVLNSLRALYRAHALSVTRGNRGAPRSWNMVNSASHGTTLQYVKQLFYSHFLRYRRDICLRLIPSRRYRGNEFDNVLDNASYFTRSHVTRHIYFVAHGIRNYLHYVA